MYNALDDLQYIGTPKAALALVPFLWHEDKDLASRAALNLATLLPKPEVENALHDYSLTEEQRKATWYKWVWEPFNKHYKSFLPIIAGRIGYLIGQLSEIEIVNFLENISNIDPRIVTPLVVQNQSKWKKVLVYIVKKSRTPKEFVKLKSILEDKKALTPTLEDWKNIFLPSKYEFIKSWHLCLIVIMTIVIFSMTIVFFAILLGIIAKYLLVYYLSYIIVYLIIGMGKEKYSSCFFSGIFIVVGLGLLVKYLSFTLSMKIWLWSTLVIALYIILILKIGLRKEREAKNPLHGLFKLPKQNGGHSAILKDN